MSCEGPWWGGPYLYSCQRILSYRSYLTHPRLRKNRKTFCIFRQEFHPKFCFAMISSKV
jgi:hypothetical protein